MLNILRFGRWRGQPIGSVPIDYVLWLLGQRWFAARWPELYPAARDLALKHFTAEVARERRHWADDLV